MNIESIHIHDTTLAVVSSDAPAIFDTASALDLAMTVQYKTGTADIIFEKSVFCQDFFILSTGLAGEILQKFTNYQIRAAICGDYSRYTSKPLRDFIYESNKARSFFFVSTKEEAIQKLTAAR